MDTMTAADPETRTRSLIAACALGFAAGFLAVLLFHQPMLALLHAVGMTPGTAYAVRAAAVVGVPQFISTAFWGGIWGVIFALVAPKFPRGASYWLAAILFGAVFPTLVAWFVVAPLKALPVAGGFRPAAMATGLLVNGAWGLGTAALLAAFDSLLGTRSSA